VDAARAPGSLFIAAHGQKGELMEARGFLQSLFDFSFSSFIALRMIKILYVLTTIVVALFTLGDILLAFKISSAFGIFALLILGPIGFLLTMIYVRVLLELLMAIFRMHEDVQEINQRGSGAAVRELPPTEPVAEPVLPTAEPVAEQAAEPVAEARFCSNCGAQLTAENRFCTSCGEAAP
jgi:Domain of unknown function (DUF4282)/zinc-ribbon domain